MVPQRDRRRLRPARDRGRGDHYYEGNDPLTHGVDIAGVIVLGAVALLLTAVAAVAIERRDLRA